MGVVSQSFSSGAGVGIGLRVFWVEGFPADREGGECVVFPSSLFCGGPLFWPVGRHYLLRRVTTEPRRLCRAQGCLADVSKKQNITKKRSIYIYIYIYVEYYTTSTDKFTYCIRGAGWPAKFVERPRSAPRISAPTCCAPGRGFLFSQESGSFFEYIPFRTKNGHVSIQG